MYKPSSCQNENHRWHLNRFPLLLTICILSLLLFQLLQIEVEPQITLNLPSTISSSASSVLMAEMPAIRRNDSMVTQPISISVTTTQVLSHTTNQGRPAPALRIPPPAISPFRRVKVAVQSPEASATISPTYITTRRYVFPLQPPSVASYQHGHHDYPATDIFAPTGTQFVAVTDGYIDELSREDIWNPAINDPATRSGLYVSLIGDDGVRYYGSHLDSLAPGLEAGDRVVAGQLLGYVGSTGNARGIASHLHFGISYPTFPGDWAVRRGLVWPFQYLKAWENGEQVTPDLSQVR